MTAEKCSSSCRSVRSWIIWTWRLPVQHLSHREEARELHTPCCALVLLSGATRTLWSSWSTRLQISSRSIENAVVRKALWSSNRTWYEWWGLRTYNSASSRTGMKVLLVANVWQDVHGNRWFQDNICHKRRAICSNATFGIKVHRWVVVKYTHGTPMTRREGRCGSQAPLTTTTQQQDTNSLLDTCGKLDWLCFMDLATDPQLTTSTNGIVKREVGQVGLTSLYSRPSAS